ncbi:RluA family pseudouridine synthase [bacterium]|nr:RluA family pseudouridine synthase [bacterium]
MSPDKAADWYSFSYEGVSGERLDAALTQLLRQRPEFAELSRARIQALIEQGGVLLGGIQAGAESKKLRPGMPLSVDLNALRALLRPPAPDDLLPYELPLSFHYIDQYLAVVEKPAGISVHPSPTDSGPSLAAALLHHFGQLSDASGPDRPGIVHRLDKETSGLLVVARDNPTHVALQRQFARREVEKLYLALCLEEPSPAEGRIELPIERHPRQRQLMWCGGRGKPALSEYRLAQHIGPFSLLEVAIHSGRTHQIRVHLKEIGLHILSDMKYGETRNNALRRFLGATSAGGDPAGRREWGDYFPDVQARLALLKLLKAYAGIFLHAHRLSFTHPASNERLDCLSEPPEVWSDVAGLFSADSD